MRFFSTARYRRPPRTRTPLDGKHSGPIRGHGETTNVERDEGHMHQVKGERDSSNPQQKFIVEAVGQPAGFRIPDHQACPQNYGRRAEGDILSAGKGRYEDA